MTGDTCRWTACVATFSQAGQNYASLTIAKLCTTTVKQLTVRTKSFAVRPGFLWFCCQLHDLNAAPYSMKLYALADIIPVELMHDFRHCDDSFAQQDETHEPDWQL